MNVLCALLLLLFTGNAPAAETFTETLAAYQRTNPEMIVGVPLTRLRQAENTWIAMEFAGTTPRGMLGQRYLAAFARQRGDGCGLWVRPGQQGWTATPTRNCNVPDNEPQLTAAYELQRLDVRGARLGREFAVRAGALDQLDAIRRRDLQQAAGGLVFGLLAYTALGWAMVDLTTGLLVEALIPGEGFLKRASQRAGALLALSVPLGVASIALIATQPRTRMFFSEDEVQAGIDEHNRRLRQQLGLQLELEL